MNTPLHLQPVHEAFATGAANWTTCDWPCHCPQLNIDLCGLKSINAQRMARATCGKESMAWQSAFRFLLMVEEKALQARDCGERAVAAAERGDFHSAWKLAEDACRIEAEWHSQPGWKTLASLLHDYATNHAFGCSNNSR